MTPKQAVLTMGDELSKCAKRSNAGDVIKCLGMRIVQTVPPLSLGHSLEGSSRRAVVAFLRSLPLAGRRSVPHLAKELPEQDEPWLDPEKGIW